MLVASSSNQGYHKTLKLLSEYEFLLSTERRDLEVPAMNYGNALV